MGICYRIAVAAVALWAFAGDASGQCTQCGHAGHQIHAGRCYPNCSTGCRTCALRPRMLRHGREHQPKDKSIRAIARFHPVPTRPVFEPRHVGPVLAPPVITVMDLPSSNLPKVPSPESVLRRVEVKPERTLAPSDAPILKPTPKTVESHDSHAQRASYTVPAPAAKKVPAARPAFAWFFRPHPGE
jgi:hypothetical protein